MTLQDFDRIARDHGLTRRQLAMLSLCQSEVYHRIRFSDLADDPESSFPLSESLGGRRRATLERLVEAGLIEIFGRPAQVRVTSHGWSIPCNSGATVFLGGSSDQDVIELEPLEPLTRFGPQYAS